MNTRRDGCRDLALVEDFRPTADMTHKFSPGFTSNEKRTVRRAARSVLRDIMPTPAVERAAHSLDHWRVVACIDSNCWNIRLTDNVYLRINIQVAVPILDSVRDGVAIDIRRGRKCS